MAVKQYIGARYVPKFASLLNGQLTQAMKH